MRKEINNAPFGWKSNTEMDIDEQRVIASILWLHCEGKRVGGIVRRLNSTHVPCRGSAWHAKTVSRVIGRKP